MYTEHTHTHIPRFVNMFPSRLTVRGCRAICSPRVIPQEIAWLSAANRLQSQVYWQSALFKTSIQYKFSLRERRVSSCTVGGGGAVNAPRCDIYHSVRAEPKASTCRGPVFGILQKRGPQTHISHFLRTTFNVYTSPGATIHLHQCFTLNITPYIVISIALNNDRAM